MKLWSKIKTEPNEMTLQSDVKIKNISKLTWIYHNTILKILIKSVPDVRKTTSSTFLETSESEESIEHNIVFIKQRFHPRFVKKNIFLWILIKYCWYPQFWHLTGESFAWVLYWLLIKVSFRYKIAHVWEENESLVISNCALEVPIRGSWKISIKTGHPV